MGCKQICCQLGLSLAASVWLTGPAVAIVPQFPSPVTDIAGFPAQWEELGGVATINVPEEALDKAELAIKKSGIAGCNLNKPDITEAMRRLSPRYKFGWQISPGEVTWPTFIDNTIANRNGLGVADWTFGTAQIKINHAASPQPATATLKFESDNYRNGSRTIHCSFIFEHISEDDVKAVFGVHLSKKSGEQPPFKNWATWSVTPPNGSWPDGAEEELTVGYDRLNVTVKIPPPK